MANSLLTRRQKRKLISAAVGLAVLGAGYVAQRQGWIQSTTDKVQQVQPGLYHVSEFVDGDTITVDMNGNSEKVRFIGVDTPETHDPRKAVQCFGSVAAAFTKSLIGTQNVRLEADPTNTNRDRYDRLLRYVYLPDNTLVNAEIIKQGYGFAYVSFPFQKLDDFKRYQADAKAQGKGLWGSCKPVENQYGGYTSNDAAPQSSTPAP
jgi:endonuclease YncB( thermonuclease family)